AQDFNTTRSNRQNSNSTINSGGAKKVVQGSDGPYNPWEMDDNNEGTVMNPLVGGNSTGGNNPLSSSVSIFAGVSAGGKDYTGNGWNGGLEYQLPIGRMLSLTAGVGFSSLEFRYRFSGFLPEKMVGEMEETIAENSWGITTLSAGPRLQIGRKKLRADIYGKAGISFVRNPKQFIGLRDEEGKVTEATGLARFSGNQTAFSILTGAAVKYALGRKVDIFINPYLHFYPAQNISFTQKDAGKALENGKDFNFELFSRLPFEKTRANLQSMGLNLGLTYYLFK
ncbi:MAG TPA: hypothetical protein PKV73_00325, partial [Agriterribacter sp.]|nr:hypothetical protein [Agriterribacter sp.]